MGTPLSLDVYVVEVLSRASTSSVLPTALNPLLWVWISVWPAAARFCTKVL